MSRYLRTVEQPTTDETQDTAQPEKRKRIRFFIDPSKSDAEIAEAIMKMAEKHFDLPDGSD